MPQKILNEGLYQDRTVQHWHRNRFHSTWWAIDLDLCGACHRCKCPLYLIEATTNRRKPHTILLSLARRADVPAFIVFHDTKKVTGGVMIWPEKRIFGSESELATYIMKLRSNHDCQKKL